MQWSQGRKVVFADEELEKYFYDFILGLTFPHLLTNEGKSARWREAMTLLSGAWQMIKLRKSIF